MSLIFYILLMLPVYRPKNSLLMHPGCPQNSLLYSNIWGCLRHRGSPCRRMIPHTPMQRKLMRHPHTGARWC